MNRILILIALSCLTLPLASFANTDNEVLAKEIFTEVLSPFCPGRALQDCPSTAASELKDEIKNDISNGKSKETILSELYDQYGDQISAVPRTRGVGLLAWLAPLLFAILGAAIITIWLRKKKVTNAPSAETTDTQSSLDPEMEERIRRELS